MNIRSFSAVKATRILPIAFLILLFTMLFIEIFVFREWKQTKENIHIIVNNALKRQDLLRQIRMGDEYAQIHLLKYIFNNGTDTADLISLRSTMSANDSLYSYYDKMTKDSTEQAFFMRLTSHRKEYSKDREKIIALVNSGLQRDAEKFNLSVLSNSFQNYQDSLTRLADYVTVRDNDNVRDMQTNLDRFTERRWTARIILFILLALVGMLIVLVLRNLKNSERNLSQSERKYRTLIERTTEIIETVNVDGRLISANNTFCEKMEYRKNEISSLHVLDTLAQESKHLYKNEPRQEEFGEIITGVQKTLQSKSGRKLYVEGNIWLSYKDGKYEGATAYYNDVTEKRQIEKNLQQSEIRYRNLFDLNPLSTWVVDRNTLGIKQVNKAAIKKFGYSESEFLKMNLQEMISDNSSSIILNQQDPGSRDFQENIVNTGKMKNKNGEFFDVELHSVDIILEDTLCKIIVAFDITEINRFEQKLSRSIINTQEEERYHIGAELHDNVCQILAAARMHLGRVKKAQIPGYEQTINVVDERVRHALDEIRNLSHELAPVRVPGISLKEALSNLLNNMNVEDKLNIRLQFEEDVNRFLENDEINFNLYRIMQEQMRNISKYARANAIVVDVRRQDNFLSFRISDDGVGFDPIKAKGGIGFANMLRRTQILGGDFKINSSPGKGCLVDIKIPLSLRA